MSKPITDIFKFAPLEIGESIVCGRLLKFNNPKFFNDPFDCDIDLLEFNFNDRCSEIDEDFEKIKTLLAKDYGEKTELIMREIVEENINEIYKKSQLDKISRSSICCFSTTFKNTTMWSHYGDNHYGICLNFDLTIPEPFVDFPSNKFGRGTVVYNDYSPVNYLKSKQVAIEKLFYTKSKDWENEEEFRYYILEEHGLYRYHKDFLKGVIFGIRVKDEEIKRFKKNCKQHDFSNIYFKRLIKDKLDIVIEEILKHENLTKCKNTSG